MGSCEVVVHEVKAHGCGEPGWSAQIGGQYKPLLFWVVLRNGQPFGVVGEGGLQAPQVADSVMNFTGYFPTP